MEPDNTSHDKESVFETLTEAEAVLDPAPQAQPRSPRKSHQPKPKAQLQLFNPAHRAELTNVFRGLRWYKLEEDRTGVEEPEEGDDQNVLPADVAVTDIDPDQEEVVDERDEKQQQVSVCTACNCSIGTIREQREHYRLDWHRYNVKRKVHGQAPVTEAEFDSIVDGLSSISGSDSSDTEENSSSSTNSAAVLSKLMNRINLEASSKDAQATSLMVRKGKRLRGSPKAFFENEDGDIVMIYKTLLSSEQANKASPGCEGGSSSTNVDLIARFITGKPPPWAVIMLSGGHFAASIVEGGVELRRKTFHSYTVRAKQGGSQGARDAKSGGGSHAKSAGASLRRYNEASFAQHIQELLESWKPDLDQCEWIFYRALSFNEKILFNGKSPTLARSDSRLKTIPFPTKRPTNSEVKRVIAFLSAVQVFGKEEFLAQFLLPSGKSKQQSTESASLSPRRAKNANIDRAKSRSPKRRDEPDRPPTTTPEDSDPEGTFIIEEMEEEVNLEERLAEYGDSLAAEERKNTGQIEAAKKKRSRQRPRRPAGEKQQSDIFRAPTGLYGDLFEALTATTTDTPTAAADQERICALLDQIKAEIDASPEGQMKGAEGRVNEPVNESQATFLHLAAKSGLVAVIWKLLELGSNPALKDKTGRYPYSAAESKDARLVFRRFRAQYPDRYEYQRGQVPEPLTEEVERLKAERKAAQNKLKREKEKARKAEQYEKRKEAEEKQRFLNLSDREKRALAAERRILGQAKKDGEAKPVLVRCFDCGADITGKIPFEYNKNVFCSTKCLAEHRRKFPTQLTA